MHARVVTVEGQPDRIDDVVGQVRDQIVPILEGQDGFKGFTFLSERSSGKGIGISFWETEEAMHASEDAVRGARDDAATTGGAGAPVVEFYEVAVDTMA